MKGASDLGKELNDETSQPVFVFLQTPSICLARSSWWAVIGSLSSLSSFLGLLLKSWLSIAYVKGALLIKGMKYENLVLPTFCHPLLQWSS